jgi:hypothetical protein
MSTTVPRWRAALNASLMDDTKRASTLTGIQNMAPNSALMQVPAIAASVAALTTKGAALSKSVDSVTNAAQQLKGSMTQRDVARNAFDLELFSLKGQVENHATSGSDITGMGFSLFSTVKPSKTPPDPPVALVVKLGNVHGKARVAVQGKGRLGRFVAEVSTDPIGPATWSPLTGTGKERLLSGYASGTKVWVRFAAVRYGLQSDWCTPVLVTIP